MPSHYDNTTGDRPWATYQNTVAAAADSAAQANATALATDTTKLSRQAGIVVSPATGTTSTTIQLTATALSNVNNQTVSWASSNTGVATVNSAGLVTKVAPGAVVITASTPNGKRGTANITIT